MVGALLVPIALQGLAMIVDEGWFHRRRGLPRWERIGHPIDTATMVACLGWLVAATPGTHALAGYVALAIVSTLVITKDEPIHKKLCSAGEQWLHAVLFALHPIVLGAAAWLWWTGHRGIVAGQLAVALGFMTYQIVHWNVRPRRVVPKPINNTWYAALGDRWYRAEDTPIALLRAEARHRNPWLARTLDDTFAGAPCRVLDLGCGGGLLANYLGAHGHRVTGIDTAVENLAVARDRDRTGTVAYTIADAYALPFADASFDCVCAMDLLEHVEDPQRLVAEASRVLAPGGLFFFHTFNRTWQANLVVIKGVQWFVANAPDAMHVYRLFRPPAETARICTGAGLDPVVTLGQRPRFHWPLWRMVLTGKVGDDFAFTFTRSTKIGYTGYARKR